MTLVRSIRWRVGIIFFVGVFSVLSIVAALYYSSRGLERITALPQPEQLASIIALIEDTPPENRQAIYEAFRSAQLSLRVAPDAEVATDLPLYWPEDDTPVSDYEAALDGREFAAVAIGRGYLEGGRFSPLTAAEFRVGLKDGGVLILAVDGVAMFNRSGIPIGFPGAILGVVVAFIALVLINREFRPVMRLAKAVETLDPSNPYDRLPPIRAGTAEVRALVEAFDRQQQRVSTLLRARSVLVGGIQHDIRTFATRLRLRVEKLTASNDRQRAEKDIEDMISLIDSALLATRSEAGELNLELLNIAELVAAEVHDRQESTVKLTSDIDQTLENLQVVGDRLALRRIVSNLIENALRYGSEARVSMHADGETVSIIVDDDGPGIPDDQRGDLLEPFARQEPSRSRETGGAGLGLAIVNKLVEGHDGTLEITDAPMGGARMIVTLPRFVVCI